MGVSSAAAYTCGGLNATLVGTNGDDRLTGTDEVDVIVGLDGKDKIFGLDGNDIICGGRGRDRIFGGNGHDDIWGNGGNDRIVGQNGKDIIHGGNGHDYVLGRAGADRIYGDAGNDRIWGGRGVDVIDGGSGDDTLTGDIDIDILSGSLGIDYCEPSNDSTSGCELPTASRAGAVYESEMLSVINSERLDVQIALLARNQDLDAFAVAWAERLADTGNLRHSPPFTGSNESFQSLPNSVNWTAAFENVGYASVGSQESPAQVIDRLFNSPNGFGFMSSPGHRCNILETSADAVGLGAALDANGTIWVAHVFWSTDSPLPSPIASCSSVVNR